MLYMYYLKNSDFVLQIGPSPPRKVTKEVRTWYEVSLKWYICILTSKCKQCFITTEAYY